MKPNTLPPGSLGSPFPLPLQLLFLLPGLPKSLLPCRFLSLLTFLPFYFAFWKPVFPSVQLPPRKKLTSLCPAAQVSGSSSSQKANWAFPVGQSQPLKKQNKTTCTANNMLVLSIQIQCTYHLFHKHFKELWVTPTYQNPYPMISFVTMTGSTGCMNRPLKWVENFLNWQVETLIIKYSTAIWQQVTSRIS